MNRILIPLLLALCINFLYTVARDADLLTTNISDGLYQLMQTSADSSATGNKLLSRAHNSWVDDWKYAVEHDLLSCIACENTERIAEQLNEPLTRRFLAASSVTCSLEWPDIRSEWVAGMQTGTSLH